MSVFRGRFRSQIRPNLATAKLGISGRLDGLIRPNFRSNLTPVISSRPPRVRRGCYVAPRRLLRRTHYRWRRPPPYGLRVALAGYRGNTAPRNRHTHTHTHTHAHTHAMHIAAPTSAALRACALVSDDAAIDPRPLLGLTRLLGERLRLPLGELVEARGQLHQVLLRLLGLGREAGHLECTGWQRGHMGRQPAPRRSPTSGARPSSARSICRPGIYPRIRLAAYLPIYY